MNKFIGTKVINASLMNRRDYITMRGWDLPKDENGDDEGYLVEYTDGSGGNVEGYKGYITWTPSEPFDKAYQPLTAMNFGHAIEMLKAGQAVSRSGWNGKRMFLYLVPAPEKGYPAQTGIAKAYFGEKALVPYGAYIAMKTATGEVVPWLASQTDVLADDWTIVPIGTGEKEWFGVEHL